MSDIPTKTYPPEFLQRLIDDLEAERQAPTGLPIQHRGDNLLQVEAPELPGAAFAYNEAEQAGATPEASSAVETKGDTMSKTPTGWQPMETAPRDGRWLLLCNQVEYLAVSGYWDVRDDDWITDVNLPYFIPAYWLPLPPAPSQRKTAMTDHSGDANKKGDTMSDDLVNLSERWPLRQTKSADTRAVEAYIQQSNRRDRYIGAVRSLRNTLAYLREGQTVSTTQMRDHVVELLDALLDMETGGTR